MAKIISGIIFNTSARKFSRSCVNFLKIVQFLPDSSNVTKLGILKDTSHIVDVKSQGSLIAHLNQNSSLEPFYNALKDEKDVYKLSEVKLLPPITSPDKVICVGLNYKEHCDEQNKPYPEQPFFFSKFPSTIVGPDFNIPHPTETRALDWEVELAVIMGSAAKDVPQEKAMDFIFGYTVAQDLSARDWQTPKRNNGQWLIAKSMDAFCPLGPAIVTKDEIPDPHNLNISCSVNGILKQNSNTNQLIHKIDKIISYLSKFFTLLPGDVILTGTPSGVGVFRNPKEFLKPGDVICSEISSVGSLTNKVV